MKSLQPLASKPNVKHIKLAVARKGKSKTENGWTSKCTRILNAFVDAKGCSFRLQQVSPGEKFAPIKCFRLSVVKDKSGQTKFKLYRTSNNRIAYASPKEFEDIFNVLNFFKATPKAQVTRLLQLLRYICKQHKFSTKGLSSNPFTLLKQLLYSGTRPLSEAVLSNLSLGRYFLDNPLKLVMNTKGKASKKIIMQTINNFPEGCQTLFRIAHYLRTTRSLDAAQNFLHTINSFEQPQEVLRYASQSPTLVDSYCSVINYGSNDITHYWDTATTMQFNQISTSVMRIFDLISPDKLAYTIVKETTIIRDTLKNYMFCLNFAIDINELPKNNINAMHDYLVRIEREQRRQLHSREIKSQDITFDSDSANMIVAQAMVDSFNSFETNLVAAIPYCTSDLNDMADDMHNCASSYAHSINKQEYIIITIKDQGKSKYMLGFRFKRGFNLLSAKEWELINNTWETGNSGISTTVSVNLEQAVTYCNEPILKQITKNIVDKLTLNTSVDDYCLVFKHSQRLLT